MYILLTAVSLQLLPLWKNHANVYVKLINLDTFSEKLKLKMQQNKTSSLGIKRIRKQIKRLAIH